MPTVLTLQLPAKAAERLIEGYRRRDPRLMAVLERWGVLEVRLRDQEALNRWENEGGK